MIMKSRLPSCKQRNTRTWSSTSLVSTKRNANDNCCTWPTSGMQSSMMEKYLDDFTIVKIVFQTSPPSK